MTYRDDLEAAQARAEAADAEAKRLRKEVERLEKRDSVAVEIDVPIPERFRVTNTPVELAVRWRWFSPAQHVFMLFFAIAWDSFLLFWYFGAPGRDGGLIFKIFPLVHVAVGIGITYSVLTGFLNSTTIRYARERLIIKHGPLPWTGNRDLYANDLTQLFVRESRTTTRRRGRFDSQVAYSYTLFAIDAGAREITLLKGLENVNEARYLERAFEGRLGIKNKHVPTEVPPDR